jgi:hypothetical protein
MITISGHEDVYIQLHILCKHIATFINVYTPLLSSIAIDAANDSWRVWVLFPVYPVGAELLIIVSIGRDNDTLAMLCSV